MIKMTMKMTITQRCLGIFLAVLIVILFAQSGLPALGWDPASTPLAYMPVILKATTPTPTYTPTTRPTATSTPTPQEPTPPPSDWLGYVNWLRSLGGLPTVTENTDWSTGCQHHARYMVKNDYIGHEEEPSNPWYTADGASAAGSSDVMVSSNAGATDIYAVDLWMSGPFHGVGIIDPALTVSGFGSYRGGTGTWQMGACLDVIRGLGSIPPSVTFPLKWPGDGGIMPYTAYGGTEAPDPLTSCPGYSAPSGPPIYLQIGAGNQTPNVTSYSFHRGTTSLDVCEFDETNYVNPNSSYQNLGRSVLNMRDAIILMPRNRLTPGATYTVSITNSGTMYSWAFTVSTSNRLIQYNSEIR
jgi:uncharacterized protein YkwD